MIVKIQLLASCDDLWRSIHMESFECVCTVLCTLVDSVEAVTGEEGRLANDDITSFFLILTSPAMVIRIDDYRVESLNRAYLMLNSSFLLLNPVECFV